MGLRFTSEIAGVKHGVSPSWVPMETTETTVYALQDSPFVLLFSPPLAMGDCLMRNINGLVEGWGQALRKPRVFFFF